MFQISAISITKKGGVFSDDRGGHYLIDFHGKKGGRAITTLNGGRNVGLRSPDWALQGGALEEGKTSREKTAPWGKGPTRFRTIFPLF